MSIEASIAQLTTAAGQLLAIPSQVQVVAQQRIQELTATWLERVASATIDVHVNDVAGGLDTNPGTAELPLRTIQRALQITPQGGTCIVRLQSAITLTAAVVIRGNRQLILMSDGPVKRAINVTRYIDGSTTPAFRYVHGFVVDGGSSLLMSGLRLVVPPLDGPFSAIAEGFGAQFIAGGSTTTPSPIDIFINTCEIEIPLAPYAALINNPNRLIVLEWTNNTLVGAITDIRGRLLTQYTNTAGTATPLRDLFTTMNQV